MSPQMWSALHHHRGETGEWEGPLKRGGGGKRSAEPRENNSGHGAGPRLGGGGCQKGNNGGERIPRARRFCRTERASAVSARRPARAAKARGYRRWVAPVHSRRWAANTAWLPPPASAVSRLLSGCGARINLSPPHSVQSQARSHAGTGRAGRAERGGAEGAARAPVGFSKRLCAVAAGRARAAGEPGSAQSPQAPAGGVEAAARRRLLQAQVNGVT